MRSSWICCAVTRLRRPSRVSNPGTDEEPLSECIALPLQAGFGHVSHAHVRSVFHFGFDND